MHKKKREDPRGTVWEAHGRAWLSGNTCSFSPWVSNNRQIHSAKKEEPRGSLPTPPLRCSSRGQSVHSQHSSPLVGDRFLLLWCSLPSVEHPMCVCGGGLPWPLCSHCFLGLLMPSAVEMAHGYAWDHQTSPTVCPQNTSSLSGCLFCLRTMVQISPFLLSSAVSHGVIRLLALPTCNKLHLLLTALLNLASWNTSTSLSL